MIAELYQNRFNEAHGYYYNGDFSLIKEESAAFFENENLPRPSNTTTALSLFYSFSWTISSCFDDRCFVCGI